MHFCTYLFVNTLIDYWINVFMLGLMPRANFAALMTLNFYLINEKHVSIGLRSHWYTILNIGLIPNSSNFFLDFFVRCTFKLSMNRAIFLLPFASLTIYKYSTNLSVLTDLE